MTKYFDNIGILLLKCKLLKLIQYFIPILNVDQNLSNENNIGTLLLRVYLEFEYYNFGIVILVSFYLRMLNNFPPLNNTKIATRD